MNAELQPAPAARRSGRKTMLSLIGGGLMGFVGASVLLAVVDAGLLGTPGPSTLAALLVALVYALTGLIVLAGLAAPKAGAQFLNVEDSDELIEQKSSLAPSGWGMIAIALMLAVIALGGPGGVIAPAVALVVTVVLLAACTALSMRSLRHSDELMRAVTGEATQVSYYLMFFFVGGWAVLAHLGFVTGPAMLDLLTAFWAFILMAALVVAGRRGMLKPR